MNVTLKLAKKIVSRAIETKLAHPEVQNNYVILGSAGCGKSAGIAEAICNVLGISEPREGTYQVGGKTVSAIFLHGATMESTSLVIPSVEQGELGSAIHTFFFRARMVADLILVYVDDVNKNPDPGFTNIIKSLLDRRIGTHSLPPTMCIMTGNPPKGAYENTELDATVVSTSGILNILIDQEDGVKYATKYFPEAAKFFVDNPDILHREPTAGSLKGYPTIRSWTSALCDVKRCVADKLHRDVMYAILASKVGESAAELFLTWLVHKDYWPLNVNDLLSKSTKEVATILKDQPGRYNPAVFMKSFGGITEEKVRKLVELAEYNMVSSSVKGSLISFAYMEEGFMKFLNGLPSTSDLRIRMVALMDEYVRV